MDINWLQDFIVLAETGNFTRAASKRNISQAAFSRRIQSLEQWLGTTLIDRDVSPIILTEQGVQFRSEAQKTLDRLLDSKAMLSDKRIGDHSLVTVAIPNVLAVSIFTPWWQQWTMDLNISARIVVGNVSEIIAKFVSGAADILICHHGEKVPVALEPDLFDFHVLATDRFQPYVAKHLKYESAYQFPGRIDDPVSVVGYTPGSYFSRLVDMAVAQAPQTLASVQRMECDMSDIMCDLIAYGYGVGWLPESSIGEKSRGRIVPITQSGWEIDLNITAFSHRDRRGFATDMLWQKLIEFQNMVIHDRQTY